MIVRDDRYGLELEVPATWTAVAGHEGKIYHFDMWTVGGPEGLLQFYLAWLPRPSNGPAMMGFDRFERRSIGGSFVYGLGNDERFQCGFELDEVEIFLYVTTDRWSAIDPILASLRVDTSVRPAPSPQRRALDLARAWHAEQRSNLGPPCWIGNEGDVVRFHLGGRPAAAEIAVDLSRGVVEELGGVPDRGGATFDQQRIAAAVRAGGEGPSPGPPAVLVYKDQRFELKSDNHVGHGPLCIIRVDAPDLERRHVRIFHAAGHYWIYALLGAPTLVNNQQLEGLRSLVHGDRIWVPDFEFRFELSL